jgi:phosphohistidine phosphatase
MVGVDTRTLVILRHAKAADPAGVPDVHRPLTKRGRADAAAAGEWLAGNGYTPDVVLCSPARRTRETWHGVATAFTRGAEVSYLDGLYAAGVADLLAAIGAVGDEAHTALLVGHNPAVSQLSALLDPSGRGGHELSTAGIAVHTWDGSWSAGGDGAGVLSIAHTARA